MAETLETAALGTSTGASGLSAWDLFMGADWVVQGVMVLLLLASFWSWTIIFAKISRLRALNQATARFEDAFWSGKSLGSLQEALQNKKHLSPIETIFCAAMREWRHPNKVGHSTTLFDRIQRILNLMITRESEEIERHMVFLGSVGSTAPFIGLFGTVWGIMHSFQSIAASQSTNLAVVAPGIAEALFATALGLVAAIPAVLAYNKLSTDIQRYITRLESFADEFMTIVSRKDDEAA
jgi:Cell division and transport-associated protein TolQ (TC 2.C.1.2.1)